MRFLQLILLHLIVMLTLCSVVVISARQNPVSNDPLLTKYGLSMCREFLCFLGIELGYSTYSEVILKLNVHPNFNKSGSEITIEDIQNWSRMKVTAYKDYIIEMYLSRWETPQLGLSNLFGSC